MELRQRHWFRPGADQDLHVASTYTVTLTVPDVYGLTGVITQPVTIVEPPGNAAPTPVNAPSCPGRTCIFSGVGTTDPNTGDTFSYMWSFGDAAHHEHLTSPDPHVPAGGTYMVTLTTTDGWGKSALTTLPVTVSP